MAKKNYIYRMKYDTGFAPNISGGLCTISGCKKNTVEKWAKSGSWVIGIGGDNTGKSDKLIYLMKVKKNLTYSQFKKKYPSRSKYLNIGNAGSNVLISRTFYYFGSAAIDIPRNLQHIIIKTQGCKCVEGRDVKSLLGYVMNMKTKKVSGNILGKPNNPAFKSPKRRCARPSTEGRYVNEERQEMIEKELAKAKAEQVKDLLTPLLKQKLKKEPKLEERSDGENRKYYKVTWSSLNIRTFAAVNMKGHLTIHKSPMESHFPYERHIRNLEKNGFKIEDDIHGNVNNKYVRWDIPNLEEFVKLQFEYYTQDM